MIAVTLEGRLGNQLFQYAFVYAAAKKLNSRFYIDKSVSDFLLPEYFDIKPAHLSLADRYLFSIQGFKNIFNHHLKIAFYTLLKKTYRLKELSFNNDSEPITQLKTVGNNVMYKGFFQSEDYFIDYKSEIIDSFAIKDKYKLQFQNLVKQLGIPVKYVAVHIRNGDYAHHNLALGYAYFHKAIEAIQHEDNYYVFVSDEPHLIENEFNYLKHKYISDNREIIDFQFIANADICILSNSSFSWWGARLNNKSPKVIAPKYWLGRTSGKELPIKVIPELWTKMD